MFLKHNARNQPNSRLLFLSASFYVPEPPCTPHHAKPPSRVTHMNGSSYKHGWVRSHSWMSPATHLNESCDARKSVPSYTWTSHITHMNGSCHTDTTPQHVYPPRRVTHMNESCHKNEWVPPHVWISHVTHMNESCYTHVCVLPHTWVSHATHMHESHHTDTTPYYTFPPRHVTHFNGSCHTGMNVTETEEWIVSNRNEAGTTNKWFISYKSEYNHIHPQTSHQRGAHKPFPNPKWIISHTWRYISENFRAKRCPHTDTPLCSEVFRYGVATVSRIDKIIGLFCRISSLL